MIAVGLPTVWTFETPSPHAVDQLEPYVGQSENNDPCNSRRDSGVNVHDEDEIMNVDQFSGPPARRERGVDRGVDGV